MRSQVRSARELHFGREAVCGISCENTIEISDIDRRARPCLSELTGLQPYVLQHNHLPWTKGPVVALEKRYISEAVEPFLGNGGGRRKRTLDSNQVITCHNEAARSGTRRDRCNVRPFSVVSMMGTCRESTGGPCKGVLGLSDRLDKIRRTSVTPRDTC